MATEIEMTKAADNPYARLTELLKKRRSHRLGFNEVRELVALHERVSADMSLAQERGLPEADILRPLVVESFSILYGERGRASRLNLRTILKFISDMPVVVRRFWLQIALVTATLILSAFGGAYAVIVSDEVAPVAVLGETITRNFQDVLSEEGDWALAASIPTEMRPAASAFIIANNIRLAIYAFVIGIFLGYFTLGVNFVNGYMLGYITSLYLDAAIKSGNYEYIYYFFAGILPHGVLEIPAIILSSSAGVAIGLSWLMPGKLSRMENLQKTAREALPLLVLAVALLVIAGLIEAFVTPIGSSIVTERELSTISGRMLIYIPKIVLSTLTFLALVLWLSFGNRTASSK